MKIFGKFRMKKLISATPFFGVVLSVPWLSTPSVNTDPPTTPHSNVKPCSKGRTSTNRSPAQFLPWCSHSWFGRNWGINTQKHKVGPNSGLPPRTHVHGSTHTYTVRYSPLLPDSLLPTSPYNQLVWWNWPEGPPSPCKICLDWLRQTAGREVVGDKGDIHQHSSWWAYILRGWQAKPYVIRCIRKIKSKK